MRHLPGRLDLIKRFLIISCLIVPGFPKMALFESECMSRMYKPLEGSEINDEINLEVYSRLYKNNGEGFWRSAAVPNYSDNKQQDSVKIKVGSHLWSSFLRRDILEALEPAENVLPQGLDVTENDVKFPKRGEKFDDFPNPKEDPRGCHSAENSTYVCNPDDLITYEDSLILENEIRKMRARCTHPCISSKFVQEKENPLKIPCNVYVLLVDRVPDKLTTERFARKALSLFGISQGNCNDGVMLVYSRQDRKPVIQWNGGEEKYINDRTVSSIIPFIDQYFQSHDLTDALVKSLLMIELLQSGRLWSETRKSQMITLIILTAIAIGCLINFISFHVKFLLKKPASVTK